MDFFTAISEGQGIIHARGVYRQVALFERKGCVYAKHGGGYVRLIQGGSTGYQAVKMGRRYLGFELKPEYADQAGKNLKDAELMAGDLFGAMG